MTSRAGQYEYFQSSTQSAAEETRQRLVERAFKLLEASMMPNTPTHKHKWATGREKWEAVQEAGAKAAGKRGRGRPRKEVNWEKKLQDFSDGMAKYHKYVLGEVEPSLPLEIIAGMLADELTVLETAGILTEEVAMAARMMLS